MNISIMPLDTYTVINKTILNENDRKLLLTLYQPIVGSTSINLYFNLWNSLDKIELTSETLEHKNLIVLMGISYSELLEARERLEGIGLIKTYIKEGEINNYVYELYSPISAHNFFINPLLSTTLYTSVGSQEYKRIKEYYKIPTISNKGYKEISKKFSDIYKSTSLVDVDTTNIRKKNFNDLEVSTSFDIDDLLMSIPDIMLNHTKVSDEIKKLIIKLSYVYNFDEEKTKEKINNSIDEKHSIDQTLLKENYNNYYKFENNGTLPSILYKTQPENLRKEITSNTPKDKVIYLFETTSPYKFICSKSKTSKPTKQELEILEYLLVDMELTPGVVNVLIDYVLKINDNKLTKNFVIAIASQWKRSNIKTVSEAMEISKKEYKKEKKETKVTRIKKQEVKPDWFNEEIHEEEDIEKQKKIEEMLNGV